MQPKVNDRGGKSVTLISTQSNRSLYVTLPMLVTWGISDYTDSTTGESDGKYTISLQFPRDQDRNDETDEALRKMKEFEDKLLNDAVKNAEVWFGKKKSREVVEDGYYSFLKYGKNKRSSEHIGLFDGKPFDAKIHEKYLKHEKIENLTGLEVELIYEWELGSMLIFDRTNLHCSSSVIKEKKIGLTTFTKL
jgi:hypothetical protein